MVEKVDSSFLNSTENFFQNLFTLASNKIATLPEAMFGDYRYTSIHKSTYKQKKKISHYLQSKYLNISEELQAKKQKPYTNFNKDVLKEPAEDLPKMKSLLLKANTQLQIAEDHYNQLLFQRKLIKSQYLNEVGYQFDRQRICSIGWGLILGGLICSTIYRKGSQARKAALFLLMGHLFGQLSYRTNIDKYFDSVYPIFKQDADQFEKELKVQDKQLKESQKLKQSIIQS